MLARWDLTGNHCLKKPRKARDHCCSLDTSGQPTLNGRKFADHFLKAVVGPLGLLLQAAGKVSWFVLWGGKRCRIAAAFQSTRAV